MTSLTQNRYNIILDIMKRYGIEFGNNIFIGLWDLAFNINNTWKAKHFANIKRFKNSMPGHDFVFNSGNVFELFRAIRHTVKSAENEYPIALRESYNNKSEYLIYKTRY